ncbi:restriction endonuclease subunit S [Paraglaciecola chathamensis]|uniref:Restriction endonuclease subunit S n=1 Tax=Paraglaciecola chathamensis TaxID=368405 RepID=A0ABS0WAP6_9ALTE|nr:restriction endonuclease subunit S [Paraglaciecola chathamensis]MBJ2135540.1 restriction endonuclease subunit S [Paraglaciecola chathamensis]
MKAYSTYQETGERWLECVPSDWKFKRFKYLFEIRKRIAGKLGFDVLSITQKGIKVKDITSGEGQLASDYSKYQIVKLGDFAMNHMDLLTGFVDLSEFEGVTSPDYRVFTLTAKDCSPQFCLYILQMGYTDKVFYPLGQGAAHVGRWRLPTESFNNFKSPIPSLNEQEIIVKYLDKETSHIDRLIEEKQQFIKLLEEKRQALISHVVTKGLDDNVEMKDSGVEWIGRVPINWNVVRLKYLCDVQTGDKNSEDYVEEGVYPFFVRSQTVKKINSYTADCEAVLTAGDGAGVGKIYHYINGKFDYHQRVYMMSNFKQIKGKLFFHYLNYIFHKVAMDGGAKSTVDSLRMPVFNNFMICVPPYAEQIAIIDYIEKFESNINVLNEQTSLSIALLKERRSALINAAVTGKIDVREAI